MNILFVTFSDKLSGGTRQLINNTEGLVLLNHEVTVIINKNNIRAINELRKLKCKIEYFNFKNFFHNFLKIKKIINRSNPGIVHCFHGKSYRYMLLLNIFYRFKIYLNRGVIFKPSSFFLFFLPQIKGIICNSHKSADSLLGLNIPISKINVVYNSVKNIHLPPQKNKKFTIIYIGNKQRYKGFDVFLKSIENIANNIDIKNINIYVCGIKNNSIFKKYVSDSILEEIIFTGGIEHLELLQYIRNSNILVVTSRAESMPNTILEAFISETGVVTTDVGGISEIISEKNGYLCASENHECISSKILDAYRKQDLLQEKIEINKNNIDFFSIKNKALKLEKIYQGGYHLDDFKI